MGFQSLALACRRARFVDTLLDSGCGSRFEGRLHTYWLLLGSFSLGFLLKFKAGEFEVRQSAGELVCLALMAGARSIADFDSKQANWSRHL